MFCEKNYFVSNLKCPKTFWGHCMLQYLLNICFTVIYLCNDIFNSTKQQRSSIFFHNEMCSEFAPYFVSSLDNVKDMNKQR